MTDDEMFVEAKRSLNPVLRPRPVPRGEYSIATGALASQIVNTSIEDEQEGYLQVGGFLYTFVSMKDLPDGTFPGMLRELMVLDFPVS